MDVKRAADLYAQGRTLRQIGAELGVTVTKVNPSHTAQARFRDGIRVPGC